MVLSIMDRTFVKTECYSRGWSYLIADGTAIKIAFCLLIAVLIGMSTTQASTWVWVSSYFCLCLLLTDQYTFFSSYQFIWFGRQKPFSIWVQHFILFSLFIPIPFMQKSFINGFEFLFMTLFLSLLTRSKGQPRKTATTLKNTYSRYKEGKGDMEGQGIEGEGIKGKAILITGAGGEAARALSKRLLCCRPKVIVLYEVCEYSLYSIHKDLSEMVADSGLNIELKCVVGSVENPLRLQSLISIFGINLVYHTASYKYSALLEQNIVEGVRSNVFGTQYVAEAAILCNVETFVLVTSERVEHPSNIAEASKKLSELVITQLATKKTAKCRMRVVRLKNVSNTATAKLHERFFQRISNNLFCDNLAGFSGEANSRFTDCGQLLLNAASPEFEDELIRNSCDYSKDFTVHDSKTLEIEGLLSDLYTACEKFDCVTVRNLLQDPVIGYTPKHSSKDLVWKESIALQNVSTNQSAQIGKSRQSITIDWNDKKYT